MSQQCVAAVYKTFDQAKQAIQTLEEAGFPHDQISLVTQDVRRELGQEELPPSGDKAEQRAAKGAGVGGVLGLLLASPLITVTGLGTMLVAGPVGAGLAGAIVGGFLGAMSGWGVDKDRLDEYEEKIRAGSLLVVANGDPAQVAQAHDVLAETPVDTLHLHAVTSANADDVDDRP